MTADRVVKELADILTAERRRHARAPHAATAPSGI
jgi:hypothetical protein